MASIPVNPRPSLAQHRVANVNAQNGPNVVNQVVNNVGQQANVNAALNHQVPVLNHPPSTWSQTRQKIDWTQIASAKNCAEGGGEPVLKLTSKSGETLWVKCFQEGKAVRAEFADKVLNLAGLGTPDSRAVGSLDKNGQQERSELIGQLDKLGTLDQQTLSEIKSRPEMLIMKNIPGAQFKSFRNEVNSGAKTVADLEAKFNDPNFQQELGKMIGADAVLGNYDRASYTEYVNKYTGNVTEQPKFQSQNFNIHDQNGQTHIHTLDNETVAPGREFTGTGDKQSWLKTLTEGESLNEKATMENMPILDQPSVKNLLSDQQGPQSVRKILQVMQNSHPGFGQNINLDAISANIAGHAQSTARDLDAKLKDKGSQEGILSQFKAEQAKTGNHDGMDYDAFKIKTKYAGLVANHVPHDKALKETSDYTDYRSFKKDMQGLMNKQLGEAPSLTKGAKLKGFLNLSNNPGQAKLTEAAKNATTDMKKLSDLMEQAVKAQGSTQQYGKFTRKNVDELCNTVDRYRDYSQSLLKNMGNSSKFGSERESLQTELNFTTAYRNKLMDKYNF